MEAFFIVRQAHVMWRINVYESVPICTIYENNANAQMHELPHAINEYFFNSFLLWYLFLIMDIFH